MGVGCLYLQRVFFRLFLARAFSFKIYFIEILILFKILISFKVTLL